MPDAPLGAFVVDHGSRRRLFVQLYDVLRQRIIGGQLAAGARLPSSRDLALELGVSRATVVLAYDQLIAEGFLVARRGSGVYVNDIGEVEAGGRETATAAPEVTGAPGVTGSPKVTGSSQTPRPFQPGRPDMRLFPHARWAQTVARVARADPAAMITAGHPFGDERLRGAIARHLGDWRGLAVPPRQILITVGAGDALELCIRTLASAGDRVALENPGYPTLRYFVESMAMRTAWLPVGESGAELPRADGRDAVPKLAVLTPSHQFPLGGAMPTSRRLAFLNWAERHGSWVIEDDYDSEFRYAGRPIPALASFDRAGRAIYIGSFSKIFSDGLRLGFLVAPEALVTRFEATLGRFGTRASIAAQRALAVFMEDGDFLRHLRRMRRIYGERRSTLMGMLRGALGEHGELKDEQAGMQIALRLAPDVDDVAVARVAAAAGVVCPALSTYTAGRHRQCGLLLGFCTFTGDEMHQAMPALVDAIGGGVQTRRR